MSRRRRLTPEARRQELLEAAIRLLHERGPDVRVEDITLAAGAAKGTFFTCFASWDDLLDAVRAHYIAAFAAENAANLAPSENSNWPEVLPGLATKLIDFILDMGGTHDVLFHSAFAHTRPLPPGERPSTRIATILRAGQAAKAYAPLDADATGRLIFAMIHETADAIAAGADRTASLTTLALALHRITKSEIQP